MRYPLFSNRAMISPTNPLMTPSGLTAMKVCSEDIVSICFELKSLVIWNASVKVMKVKKNVVKTRNRLGIHFLSKFLHLHVHNCNNNWTAQAHGSRIDMPYYAGSFKDGFHALKSIALCFIPDFQFNWLGKHDANVSTTDENDRCRDQDVHSNCVIASNCLLSFRCFLVSLPCTPLPETLIPSGRTSTPGPADLRWGNTYNQHLIHYWMNYLCTSPAPSEG